MASTFILPALPPALRSLDGYFNIANKYHSTDSSITYWSILFVAQKGIMLQKSKEDMDFLKVLMDWLQNSYQELKDTETVNNVSIAQAYIENVAMELYLWADTEDRAGRYNKYAKSRASHLLLCLERDKKPLPPQELSHEDIIADQLLRKLFVSHKDDESLRGSSRPKNYSLPAEKENPIILKPALLTLCGSGTMNFPSVYLDFQYKLEKYLRDSQPSKEDVYTWITEQQIPEDNLAFIHVLATGVFESAINGYGIESILDCETLKKWTEILKLYLRNPLEHQLKRELQLLFALETLDCQRQKPKGLFREIISVLRSCKTVSEEGFNQGFYGWLDRSLSR